jgi:hypothetical protein
MTVQPNAQQAAERHEQMLWSEKVRDAIRGLRPDEIHDGRWFRRILERHVQKHQRSSSEAHWAALYPGLDVDARVEKHIKTVARKASAAGAIASVGASTGELLSLVTEGLAAPIGVPAVLLSIVAEGTYTTLAQLDLASDLASMYGVPFGHDVDEMSTLFAIAMGLEAKKKQAADVSDEPKPKGLLARLMDLEDGEVANHLGKKLIEDAVLRNIMPVVGIAISARWNYVATLKFGSHVCRYIRYRRALAHACDKLRLAEVKNPEVLVRGAWLLASCDGEPTREEMMAIARVLGHFPEAEEHLPSFDIDDEEAWFERVAKVPDEADERLIDLLSLVAATDKELAVAERRFLARLGRTLGRAIDFDRIAQLCDHLHQGDELPDDFFALAQPPLGAASPDS